MRPLAFLTLALSLTATSYADGLFGNGSDGPLVVTDTFHLNADRNYSNVTVQAGGVIETHGFILRVSGTLTNLGVITDSYSGGEGGAGGAGGLYGYNHSPHVAPKAGSPGQSGLAGAFPEAGSGGRGGGGGGGGGGAWDNTNNHAARGGKGGDGSAGGKGGG